MKNKILTDEWKHELIAFRGFCQEYNGLPYCKNCGIDFDRLIDMIDKRLDEQAKVSFKSGVEAGRAEARKEMELHPLLSSEPITYLGEFFINAWNQVESLQPISKKWTDLGRQVARGALKEVKLYIIPVGSPQEEKQKGGKK